MITKRYANKLEKRALNLGLVARNVDERTVAQHKWLESLRPTKAQLPCDIGLFGDEHLQLDLVDMLQTYGDVT